MKGKRRTKRVHNSIAYSNGTFTIYTHKSKNDMKQAEIKTKNRNTKQITENKCRKKREKNVENI